MSGVNKVILVGRLGADPEVKQISPTATVAKLSVATSENWIDKTSGEKQERTEWHRVVVWGKVAELCGKYLAKGRQVYLEGRIQTRKWEDDKGATRYSTEVVANTVQFLGGAADNVGHGDDLGEAKDAQSSAPLGALQQDAPRINYAEEVPF